MRKMVSVTGVEKGECTLETSPYKRTQKILCVPIQSTFRHDPERNGQPNFLCCH